MANYTCYKNQRLVISVAIKSIT